MVNRSKEEDQAGQYELLLCDIVQSLRWKLHLAVEFIRSFITKKDIK